MNLKTVDAAIAAYTAELGPADAERLAFFRALWGVMDAEAAPASAADPASDARPDARFALEARPAAIDRDRLERTLAGLAQTAAASGTYVPELAARLGDPSLLAVAVGDAGCAARAGEDPASYLEGAVGRLLEAGADEQVTVVLASLLKLTVRSQIEAPAARLAHDLGLVEHDGLAPTACPVCGAGTVLARVGGKTSSRGRGRVLWCAQCGTAWEFERVRCACCGTQNHEHLHYEGIEGDEAHQLHVCDECGARVPTVFVGNDLAPFSYEVEEVVSARLAALAQA